MTDSPVAGVSSATKAGPNRFRCNPARTGAYPGPPATKGKLKWKFKTNGEVISSPTSVDGILYIGSSDNSIYALDQNTGSLTLKFDSGNLITSSPAVNGDIRYFGNFNHREGAIFALNIKKRDILWKFETGNPVSSSAVIVDQVMYVCDGGNFLYALDAKSGSLK